VPSEICYDANGHPSKWGFGLTKADSPLRWTKLLLSPLSLNNMDQRDGQEETVIAVTRKRLKTMQKSVLDVVSDYLRFLWNHILEHLRIRLSAPALDNMMLKVVLTVPAIWDNDGMLFTALDFLLCI
jgi:hypothetical protein